ncbi:MAG: ATP-dependent 6-phosphofructokinase, partial [Alphaproteobacteria bacterium]
PRQKVFFNPETTVAGIVTCGGLCPGLNDVIRSIVLCLWHHYDVHHVLGFRYGYRGLISELDIDPRQLTPKHVRDIHRAGGTMLGSSRGFGDRTGDIVDTLQERNVKLLFTIGGDGSQRAALDVAKEVARRDLEIAVVGVPKTIDNDVSFVERSFGFETAVSIAVDVIAGAHVEAHDAVNGIGLVKLMGRHSGFIAAHSVLGNNDVNYCLVPEVPFELDGPRGLLASLEHRLHTRGHAVIVVAEGAGQELLEASGATDASGNVKLQDIGPFLAHKIEAHFKEKDLETNLKYIDPSYSIRSAPASANDSIYCARLGADAVHAAMSGRTGMIVSLINSRLVHVPIRMAVANRNQIDPQGDLWRDVIGATGQPCLQNRTGKVEVPATC